MDKVLIKPIRRIRRRRRQSAKFLSLSFLMPYVLVYFANSLTDVAIARDEYNCEKGALIFNWSKMHIACDLISSHPLTPRSLSLETISDPREFSVSRYRNHVYVGVYFTFRAG